MIKIVIKSVEVGRNVDRYKAYPSY